MLKWLAFSNAALCIPWSTEKLVCAQQVKWRYSSPKLFLPIYVPRALGRSKAEMLSKEWIYRTQSFSAVWTIPVCSDSLGGSDFLQPEIRVICVPCVTWAGRTNLGTSPPRLSLLESSLPCGSVLGSLLWAVWAEPAQLCVQMQPPVSHGHQQQLTDCAHS